MSSHWDTDPTFTSLYPTIAQGVLSGCASRTPTSFYIQARDTSNGNRTTGADVFEVVVQSVEGAAAVAAAAKAKAESKRPETKEEEKESIDDGIVPVTLVDEGNGRYLVTYTAPAVRS